MKIGGIKKWPLVEATQNSLSILEPGKESVES